MLHRDKRSMCLHEICTRMLSGHFNVRVRDSSRRSEETATNLELRLRMRLLLLLSSSSSSSSSSSTFGKIFVKRTGTLAINGLGFGVCYALANTPQTPTPTSHPPLAPCPPPSPPPSPHFGFGPQAPPLASNTEIHISITSHPSTHRQVLR